jgi:non-reducing end alpha-L-arabinofuranosidase
MTRPRSLAFAMATALLSGVLLGIGTAPAQAADPKPCDIYASGGTPCVAAHSTVRALYSSYNGNLYQVRRASDNTTRNISVLAAGGTAHATAQDSFCANTSCVLTVVHDQSGRGNDLWYQGSSVVPGSSQSRPASATSESSGYPSDATENAVQADIIAAGYATGGGTGNGTRVVTPGRATARTTRNGLAPEPPRPLP